jgi:hypothetical protein
MGVTWHLALGVEGLRRMDKKKPCCFAPAHACMLGTLLDSSFAAIVAARRLQR